MNESTRMILTLVIVSLVSTISLSFVYDKTEPIIKEKKLEELRRSLNQVIPTADRFEEDGELKELISEERGGIKKVFNAYKNNEKTAIALLMDSIGFGGTIKILVGIDINSKKITNTKILEHLETPGLGERIAGNEFLAQFTDKSIKLNENDIDAITGATISSTAVIKTITENVNKISEYAKNKTLENASI